MLQSNNQENSPNQNLSYNKITNLNIECSPSYLFNNLTSTKDSLYFIHNSESLPRVLVIHKQPLLEGGGGQNKSIDIFNTSESNEMIFVKAFHFTEADYIAIGLYNGFKLWNSDGSRLLFQISERVNKNKIYAMISCTGFVLFDNNNNNLNSSDEKKFDSILVGDNYGQLSLIHGTKSNWKSRKIFSTNKCEAILALGSYPGYKKISSCIDNGSVMIFDLEGDGCKMIKEFKNNNELNNIGINCVIIKDKDQNNEFSLITGYINGEIKIFKMEKLMQVMKISQNLRSVGPMIVIKENMIVSGSDDGEVIIWEINFDNNENIGKVKLIKNFLFEDKMIVGLSYDSEKGNLFINAFDSPELSLIEGI